MVNHPDGISRREFLKGAAVILGGSVLAACQKHNPLPIVTAEPGMIPTLPPGSAVDTILHNGTFLTMDGANSIAQAVAISGDKILQVGSNRDILALASPETTLVNLHGKVASPGLIDSHFHFLIFGQKFGYLHPFLYPDVRDKQDLLEALSGVIANTPPGEWVQGYFMFEGFPDRYELDAVAPNNPVWIIYQAGHVGIANSLALAAAGLAESAPLLEGGIVEVDSNGVPTGVLYNHLAMNLVRAFIPPYTGEMAMQNFPQTQQLMASTGVTSFHDNNVYNIDLLRAYQDFSASHQNILSGSFYAVVEKEEDVEYVLQIPHYQDAMTRFAGFKILIDGQMPTAYCHEPHNGISWNMPTWDIAAFKRTVRTFHDTGLQISVHCIGDAAVDLTLDAFEEAMNANPRPDPRHRIEHAIVTKPEATRRMKDLGVALSVQPQFLYWCGSSYTRYFGEERASRIIVTREWMEAGVPTAISSDAPTMPMYTPQFTMAGAMSRLTKEDDKYFPDQCLTFEEALRAHTMNAAYAGHEEHIKGSLETGKLADIIVWTKDPRRLNAMHLFNTTIDRTIIGGQTVYSASV